MRYLDEYRDHRVFERYRENIAKVVTRPWTLMEICGGQTHTIMKFGIESLLPPEISLVHGPGCPVCVTPVATIDKAIALASQSDVIFTSFGDMLRVPGSASDLLTVKAGGGQVRVVYSPLDAIRIAQQHPASNVVFFAVGFETTAPANAMAVWKARQLELKNFSILCSHVIVPPALEAILSSPANMVQGILAAGHVCTVMGYEEYLPLAASYRVPIVVTGFEPVDILQGILMAVRQLEEKRCDVENQYARAVRREGNIPARELIASVFEVTDCTWRGIGAIPRSGYKLRPEYSAFDAAKRFQVEDTTVVESPYCIAGMVLQGRKKPPECPVFGESCTPEHPLGAPMVSSEGACAAYFRYQTRIPQVKAQRIFSGEQL